MPGRKTWLRRLFGAALLSASLAPARAAAADHHELRYDSNLDNAVIAGGGAVWIASEVMKNWIAPDRCRWCAVDGVDAWFQRKLRADDTSIPDVSSSLVAFLLEPFVAFGTTAAAANSEGRGANTQHDLLVITEATVIAANVNQITKLLVGRERPFVHALPDEKKSGAGQVSDHNLSFFSGHTMLGFTLATASGTVASMRKYEGAPAVWGIGLPLAFLTGVLRIEADKHYFTDVVVGMLVGSAIGVAVPYVFHHPASSNTVPTPTGGAAATQMHGTGFSFSF